MDYYQIISENFQNTIETIAGSVDTLAGPIEMASQLMVGALLEDHKIIACGNGVDGALAQLFTSNLLSRFEHDRPALPALNLGSDGSSLTAIAQAGGLIDVYSRQLRALGQQGDILLSINSTDEASNMLRAIQSAHQRNMRVVALSTNAGSELSSLLRPDDVELRVNNPRRPKVVELHTMVIHCLCELIEHNLFGSYHQE
jgi:phosphoheptose isomerase